MGIPAPLVVAIVGADGCGKSSTYRGLLERLATGMEVRGIGEEELVAGPGTSLGKARASPTSTVTARTGRLARRADRWRIYRALKLVELSGRARLRDTAVARAAERVLVTDGDPLVNSLAWSAAGYYADELAGDEERLAAFAGNLAGEARVALVDLPHLPRRAWHLALAQRLRLARFAVPDLAVHLHVDGATALGRIASRARPRQAHESAAFIDRLDAGYARACRLLEERWGMAVVRVDTTTTDLAGAISTAEIAVLDELVRRGGATSSEPVTPVGRPLPASGPGDIHVIATTISGSLRDQRKVGRTEPAFRSRTARPVHVHAVDSHAEARDRTREIVAAGGRTLVSAGGAGTFNAVLEGCHLADGVPADLRLAFLRKGSADLIGKALRIPDDLDGAVDAIVGGIERDADLRADIVAVEGEAPDGGRQVRHVVGFGGLGLFGDVPRFTESRVVKLYKGILGTLFGDYGPFFVGLTLATIRWFGQRALGRVEPVVLVLDDQPTEPATWLAVIVAVADLGPDFPLGRGLGFGSGTFRVVALRYEGLRRSVAQLRACRSAAVLDEPERYGALVREVHDFVALPAAGAIRGARAARPAMVNVDGLRMPVRGEVRLRLSGSVRLVPGAHG